MWSPTFRRSLIDEEIQVFSHLMSLLTSYFAVPDEHDTRIWIPDSKGIFSVKSYYNTLTIGSCPLMNESYV